MKIALSTLDVFRSTVGAAALGFARRALDEAIARVRERKLFGARWRSSRSCRPSSPRWRSAIDASALLVYRAAWTKDTPGGRVTREAAMAKLYATESAQQVIDAAVQLLRRARVAAGHRWRALPRDPRAADLRGRVRSSN